MAKGYKTGGRTKGTPNKMPNEARAYVLAVANALEQEGRGMLEWARENPNEYWSKVYKAVVPREVDANLDGKITISWQE